MNLKTVAVYHAMKISYYRMSITICRCWVVIVSDQVTRSPEVLAAIPQTNVVAVQQSL